MITTDVTLLSVFVAAFTSAVVAGLFLVGQSYISRRAEGHRIHEDEWTKVGIPLLSAADDLIARIFDVIVRKRSLDFGNPFDFTSVDVFNPQREISTIWRLFQYLAATSGLENSSFEGGGNTRIDNLRLYANKSRIALKGNIFGAPAKIQTEAQEAIGSKILSLGSEPPYGPADFYEFSKRLPSDQELQDCVNYVKHIFDIQDGVEHQSSSLLTIANFSVYLIDAIQDLKPTSKWEEFRILLVSIIRTYNRSTQKTPVYLYHRGDLGTEHYLDTYAFVGGETKGYFGKFRRDRRLVRRAKSGFSRALSRDGVSRIESSNKYVLSYQATPGEILKSLGGVFS
jgi:hypothetical protein